MVLAVTVTVVASVVAGSAILGAGKRDAAAAAVSDTAFTSACPVTPAADDDDNGHVEVTGVWGGEERMRFRAVLERFSKETGVKVEFATGSSDAANPDRELTTNLQARIASGCPPDVALLPQPGLLAELARGKHIKPLPEDAAKEVRGNYSPAWRDLATFDNQLYGVWFKASNKSLFWYRGEAFERASVEPPRTWADLQEAASKLADNHITPFSVAGGDGWTLTDWFENIYLRTAGADMYDQLAQHRIPWTDPSVEKALGTLGQILGGSDWLAGGTEGALRTNFEASVENVFGALPTAAMVYEGDFVANQITKNAGAPFGSDAKVFPFPAVDRSEPTAMALGGDIAVLLNDKDKAARRLIHFLATPEAAEPWARAGGFTSPNKKLDLDVYPDENTRESAAVLTKAETIRFDMSDLQPPSFGATPGQGMWKIFQDFLRNPTDVKGTATSLEKARLAAE